MPGGAQSSSFSFEVGAEEEDVVAEPTTEYLAVAEAADDDDAAVAEEVRTATHKKEWRELGRRMQELQEEQRRRFHVTAVLGTLLTAMVLYYVDRSVRALERSRGTAL